MKNVFYVGLLAVMLIGCSSSVEHKYHGTALPAVIESVDVASQKLTVLNIKSAKITDLAWSKDSRFWANGVRIEPRQLRRGDAVTIHYRIYDGKMWLQHLYLNTNRTVE